jgi:hypothetical protein
MSTSARLKTSSVLFLAICLYTILPAQNKNDYTWILGTPVNHPELLHGGNLIDFSSGAPIIEYFVSPIDMWYPNIMSNERGQLSFYNNGCKIMNASHQLIENGSDINAGTYHDTYCNYPGHPVGYPAYQGLLSLPYPGHPGEYILFHMWVNENSETRLLLYTHIDMNANNGQGKVISKNTQLYLQDFFSRSLTATRHANGRDWWVVAARDTSSVYFLYLLDPDGIHGPFIQEPDAGWVPGHETALSNNFSPDGSKYVRVGGDIPADFRLYNFDRCSGTFSNPITVQLPDSSVYLPWACFSPNSRFIYVQNAGLSLYQFDTWASDINGTVQLIDTYDGFLSMYDLPTTFNNLVLGPDQRIYLGMGNGTNLMHTIHKPNELGISCDFRQHDVVMPAHYRFYLPNFPNYRLYNLPGSPCDSLGVKPLIVAFWRSEPGLMAMGIDFTDISYYQPTSWFWYFGDGSSDTIPSSTHIYSNPGVYDVCLVVCNNQGLCDTLCREIEVKKGSSAISLGPKTIPVQLYPNPADDYLIVAHPEIPGTKEIRVYDTQAKEIT